LVKEVARNLFSQSESKNKAKHYFQHSFENCSFVEIKILTTFVTSLYVSRLLIATCRGKKKTLIQDYNQ